MQNHNYDFNHEFPLISIKKKPIWDKRGMVVPKESDTYKCLNIQECRFLMWCLALQQCGFIVLDFILNDPWSL